MCGSQEALIFSLGDPTCFFRGHPFGDFFFCEALPTIAANLRDPLPTIAGTLGDPLPTIAGNLGEPLATIALGEGTGPRMVAAGLLQL
uniref:Uncharacterized protein n=1 Tax=Arundo donax TaxID=35708 RepID=A0A0A9FYB2_ARUDO